MTQAGLALSTVRQAHQVISLLLAMALRDGRLSRNVAAGVRLPRVVHAEEVFLTHAQVDELAAEAKAIRADRPCAGLCRASLG
jgi:hypothetical protein